VHSWVVCLQPFSSNVISWVQSLQPPSSLDCGRPSTFNCNIRSDSPMARKFCPNWMGLCRLADQDPTFGFGLLVSSSVPSLGAVSSLWGYWQWGRCESEILTGRAEWVELQNDVSVNHGMRMPYSLKHYMYNRMPHATSTSCLQCFDTVGWAAGRASGL